MKTNEKMARNRYIRTLEKFYKLATTALKKEQFDKNLFQQRMLKNCEFFQKSPAVRLNSTYTKELESFVNACLDFSFSQKELINKANALDKLKRTQNYKKDKHKNKFKDFQ